MGFPVQILQRNQRSRQAYLRPIQKQSHAQSFSALHGYQPPMAPDMIFALQPI
jgi:hypothetical protein